MGDTISKRKLGKKIREGFEGWLEMDKREKMLQGEEQNDSSLELELDELPDVDGCNTRTGFPKYKSVLKSDCNLLVKPRTVKL